MTKQAKSIPEFTSEAQERAFWETHDSAEYLDWRQARKIGRLTVSQGVFVAEGTVIAGLTRNPVFVWHWIPGQARDDKSLCPGMTT